MLFRLFVTSCTALMYVSAQASEPRLGASDPLGSPNGYALFRNDKLFYPSNPRLFNISGFTNNLSFENQSTDVNYFDSAVPRAAFPLGRGEQIFTTAGNVLQPDKQEIVLVYRGYPSPDSPYIHLKNGRLEKSDTLVVKIGSGEDHKYTISPGSSAYLTPRSSEPLPDGRMIVASDLFAVAAGDLDRLPDANYQYHDEVVVAYVDGDPLGDSQDVNLSVLNYGDSSSSDPVETRAIGSVKLNLLKTAGPTFDEACDLCPLLADNQVSVSIGDFDGDGYNEIALAYIVDGTHLVVDLFRYRTSASGDSSLELISSGGSDTKLVEVFNNSVSAAVGSFLGRDAASEKNFAILTGSRNLIGSRGDQLILGFSVSSGHSSRNVNKSVSQVATLQAYSMELVDTLVTDATNAKQGELTADISSSAAIPQTIVLSGGTGPWSAVNGTWHPTITGPRSFTIPVDSTNFGSFSGQNIRFKSDGALSPFTTKRFLPYQYSPFGSAQQYLRVQIVPGLFHFDPGNGFDFSRRELAVAWNNSSDETVISLDELGPDISGNSLFNERDRLALSINGHKAGKSFALAAGGFIGNNNPASPVWPLGLSTFNFDGNVGVAMLQVTGDQKLKVTCSASAENSQSSCGALPPQGSSGQIYAKASDNFRLPIAAIDSDGTSLRVGAPIHYQVTNPAQLDYILEQPPQHTAWLALSGSKGPAVVNISRYPTFTTSLLDNQQKGFTTKTTERNDSTIGTSASQNLQLRAYTDFKAGFLKGGTNLSVDVSTKLSYSKKTKVNDLNSKYKSTQVDLTGNTAFDDLLVGKVQIVDVWRYRLYGFTLSNSAIPYPFYEISFPAKETTFVSGGLDTDWYVPIHETGNILSYPDHNTACSPADLAPISQPGEPDILAPLLSCQKNIWNGTASSVALKLDEKVSNGKEIDNSQTLNASADLKVSFSTEWEADFLAAKGGAGVSASATVGASAEKSWGDLTVTDNVTTHGQGITVTQPAGVSTYAYGYEPIFYNTKAGTLKVGFATDPLASDIGKIFWRSYYSGKPDPALNLPFRFVNTSPGGTPSWTANTFITRKKMRGLFARKSVRDAITGEYELIGTSATDGDRVLLDARVYNYSLGPSTGAITVQFSYIAYDENTNREICPGIPANRGAVCPVSFRTIIGKGSSAPDGGDPISLELRQMKDAYIVWNTQGLAKEGVQSYRIYVDLNPGNSSNELYPEEPPCTAFPCETPEGDEKLTDPGQNNEGWGVLTIKPATANSVSATTASSADESSSPESSAKVRSSTSTDPASLTDISVEDSPYPRLSLTLDNGLPGGNFSQPTAFLGRTASVRVEGNRGDAEVQSYHAFIFNGPPADPRSRVIAAVELGGSGRHDSAAWFDWTPKRLGLHHLYAVIGEYAGPDILKESEFRLAVNVRPAPCDLNADGRVDRHDLNMLSAEMGKTVNESVCGVSCDLDGDGRITGKDLELLSALCDSEACAFASPEYVGGVSAAESWPKLEPFGSGTGDNQAAAAAESELYQSELRRKQDLQTILYYYKGQAVTRGPYATQAGIALGKK